jgi:hypothetical protein
MFFARCARVTPWHAHYGEAPLPTLLVVTPLASQTDEVSDPLNVCHRTQNDETLYFLRYVFRSYAQTRYV